VQLSATHVAGWRGTVLTSSSRAQPADTDRRRSANRRPRDAQRQQRLRSTAGGSGPSAGLTRTIVLSLPLAVSQYLNMCFSMASSPSFFCSGVSDLSISSMTALQTAQSVEARARLGVSQRTRLGVAEVLAPSAAAGGLVRGQLERR